MTPHNLEAEENLVCCIATADPDLRGEILAATPREYIFDTGHQTLFDVLKELHESGQSVEYTTVVNALEKRKFTPEIARNIVMPIVGNLVMTPLAWETYHTILQEKFNERQITNLIKDLQQTKHLPTESHLQRVQEFKEKITPRNVDTSDCKQQMLSAYVNELELRQSGEASKRIIPTGFHSIDNRSGGVFRKNMGVVSALPGIGKTALGVTLLLHSCVESDFSGLLVSVEQGREEIIDRMVSSISRIPHDTLQRKKLNKGEMIKTMEALDRISKSKIHIIDDPRITLEGIQMAFRKYQPDIGFVDYAQKIKAPECKEDGSREQQLAYISAELARTAIENNCYLLLGSQETVGQNGKVNTKHCASIVEDTHDWFRLTPIKDDPRTRRLECMKRRSGESGWNEKLTFLSQIVRFENYRSDND